MKNISGWIPTPYANPNPNATPPNQGSGGIKPKKQKITIEVRIKKSKLSKKI